MSVRVSKALQARIRAVAERLGYSDAEVIRLATGIGLEHLRRIGYDVESALLDASMKAGALPARGEVIEMKAAEEPPGKKVYGKEGEE